MVNKTSAVENCLTSSIGRALAACGLSGGNYASFEEVDHAINDKAEAPSPKPKKKQTPPVKLAPQRTSLIEGKEWSLEDRMNAIKEQVTVDVKLDTITEVLDFIYTTIVMFALPPEDTPQKPGDPETAAGWVQEFTDQNRPTLLKLYNQGFQNEIKQFHERLDPLRQMTIEELRTLQKSFQQPKGDD